MDCSSASRDDYYTIESGVVTAFAAWLNREGWPVRTEVDFVDVVAERDGIALIAEAKGTTNSAGLDAGTAYGQLLRRISPDEGARRYALVVPPLLARRPSAWGARFEQCSRSSVRRRG